MACTSSLTASGNFSSGVSASFFMISGAEPSSIVRMACAGSGEIANSGASELTSTCVVVSPAKYSDSPSSPTSR